jgi:hypothetical protein
MRGAARKVTGGGAVFMMSMPPHRVRPCPVDYAFVLCLLILKECVMSNVLRDQGFRTHLIVYAAVNAGLLVINLASASGDYWFQWPLIGWGIGILGHAFLVSRKTDAAPVPGETNRPM